MKNHEYERKRRLMREYHRRNPWRLNSQGLYLPHVYEAPPRTLSWWDHLGFVTSGYRVIVWWRHPRMAYADMVEDLAHSQDPDILDQGNLIAELRIRPIHRKRGRSRKKVVAYAWPGLSEEAQDSYARQAALKDELLATSELEAVPSMRVSQLTWARGIELCMPMEIRCVEEAAEVATIAKRLYRGETSLAELFPHYRYTRETWEQEGGPISSVMELSHAVASPGRRSVRKPT